MAHKTSVRIPKSRRSKTVDLGLDISDVVLTTLKEAARLAPVPYLQQSAGLALAIVNIIQGVRDNKTAFSRLANDACELVYTILCTARMDAGGTKSRTHLDHLRELIVILSEIEKFAANEASRNKVIRIIKHRADLDTIQEYREKLRQSLDVFGLKSNISIHENLNRIEEMILEMRESKQEELREAQLAREEADKKAVAQAERDAKENAIMEREERDRREADEGRRRWETERIAAATQQHAWEQSNYGTPSVSFPNSFYQHRNPFSPPVAGVHGNYTSVGGNQNTYTDSVINTNSGNTTTNTVSNSNNDSSIRILRGPIGRDRRR